MALANWASMSVGICSAGSSSSESGSGAKRSSLEKLGSSLSEGGPGGPSLGNLGPPLLHETYYRGRRGRSYLEEELTKSHNVSKYQPEVMKVS